MAKSSHPQEASRQLGIHNSGKAERERTKQLTDITLQEKKHKTDPRGRSTLIEVKR